MEAIEQNNVMISARRAMDGWTIVRSATYITTSWDDGHPLDLRVAALLSKYGIGGTFYVPATAERETMSASQLRELARAFEIGAHTLHHVDLTRTTDQIAWHEIADSKSFIENNTGVPCACFCPPIGHYGTRHLHMIRRADYLGVRTTEFPSLDFPRSEAGLVVMPTSVQAFPHRFSAFARNAVKRRAMANLWRYVVYGCGVEWHTQGVLLLCRAIARGGVFHLWGHSWELRDFDQWERLTELLRFMSSFADLAPSVTNGQLCRVCAPSFTVFEGASQAAKTAKTTKITAAGG